MTTPCSVHGCPEPARWTLLGRLVPHCRVHMLDAMRATGFNHPAVRIPPEPEPQADIVERLRRWTRAALAPACYLMDEAADEIERLRITDEEWEAAQLCYEWAMAADYRSLAATLRGLLDRHGGCPEREQQARKGHATPARSGESGDDSPDRE